jgi:hypothetical protein
VIGEISNTLSFMLKEAWAKRGAKKKTLKDERPSNGCSDRQLGINFLGQQVTREVPKRFGHPSQQFCNGLAKMKQNINYSATLLD